MGRQILDNGRPHLHGTHVPRAALSSAERIMSQIYTRSKMYKKAKAGHFPRHLKYSLSQSQLDPCRSLLWPMLAELEVCLAQ